LGDTYTGKVTRLLNFGAMVEILPGKEGLIHISKLADHYVSKVEDVVKVDDEIIVKVIEIDDLGRINLSHKTASDESSDLPDTRKIPSASKRHQQKRPDRRYGQHT